MIVDSNVWVFAEIRDGPEYAPASKATSTLLAKGGAATNVIIASEVFHTLSRLCGVQDARRRVGNITDHPEVEWIEFTPETVAAAARLCVERGLKINDALIAAQAVRKRASVLTANVKDFRRVPGLKVVALRAQRDEAGRRSRKGGDAHG